MASSGDQLFAHGITFDTTSGLGGVGQYRLETDGTNMYFNGSLLTRAADTTENFTAENNIYTSNIVFVDSSNTVAIKFTNSNISLTSNLILKELGASDPLPIAGSGLVSHDGDLFYNGAQVGAAQNAFNVITTDLVTPKNTLSSNLIKLDANVQISEILWANSANITTVVDLDFNKSDPKIFHNSGKLSIESVSGESSLSIRSFDHSNVQLYSNVDGTGENKSHIQFYGSYSSSETLLGQIQSEPKNNQEGSTFILQNINPNDSSSMMNMIETYSNSTANVVALGPNTTDNIIVGVDATDLPEYKFTVGDAGTTKFAVDTTGSKVKLASGMGLEFDGPINISQTGDKLQIGTTTTPGAESILIGPSVGTAGTIGVLSIGVGAGQIGQTSNTTALGFRAGQSNQKSQSVAVGYLAGQSNQNTFSVALGAFAGQITQNTDSIALGFKAGQSNQGSNSVALGCSAGNITQNKGSVSIGHQAGQSSQDSHSVSVGYRAGQSNQNTQSVAVGYYAGEITQNTSAVAVGAFAGESNQGPFSISIGDSSGESQQSANCVSIGAYAGQQSQKSNSIAIGQLSGYVNQNTQCIAIGVESGKTSQRNDSIAIGRRAGYNKQNTYAISIGYDSGYSSQSTNTVAIGHQSGYTGQSANCISIGMNSGRTNQGTDSVAIGSESGYVTQGHNSISIGRDAGRTSQGSSSISIGSKAGELSQGYESTAIGRYAGQSSQSVGGIAVGFRSGEITQGSYAIAIGHQAGKTSQHNNSIVINATGNEVNTTFSGFHVSPIRDALGTISNVISWNASTKEIVNTGAITIQKSNVGIGNVSPDHALSVDGAIYASNLIINNAVTALGAVGSTMTVNMNNENYRTYSASISSTDTILNITNPIAGCQGVIYLSATGTSSISTSDATQYFNNPSPSFSSGDKGVIAFSYDGTSFYISSSKYTLTGT